MLKSPLFLILLTYSFPALAVGPTVTGVAGASNYTLPSTSGTTTTGSTVIYGGLAGNNCSADGGTTTCNSCTVAHMTANACVTAAQALCACNTVRIHTNSSMSITIRRGDTTTGNIRVAVANGTAYNTVGSGTGDAVTVTWDAVCGASDLGGNCETVVSNKTINAKIFVDKDNGNDYDATEESSVATDFSFRLLKPSDVDYSIFANPTSEGIGGGQGFKPYPGDAKVYIEDIDATTGFPALGYGGKVTKVRVFNSSEGLATATVESPSSTDLNITTDGTNLERNVVTAGLSNNTTYIFRIAMVDEAGNVVQFFPDAGADASCDDADPVNRRSCPWAATPEEVLGLLTDDINCFIATAAYGSFLEPKLDTFREFKFKILLQNWYGRKFVQAYYELGPYAARWIHDKPWLRKVTQAALWPVYLYSRLALNLGFWPATFLAFLLLMSISAAVIVTTRRGFARAQ